MHIVEIATGVDTTIKLPALDPYLTWGVVSYKTAGIYLHKLPYEGNSPSGMWLFNPATGSVQPAEESDALRPTLQGAAWKGVIDPGDAHPSYSSYAGAPLPDELVRQDLLTGEKVVWFYKAGHIVDFLGVDWSGRPFVLVAGGQSSLDSVELRLVAAPGQGELLSSDSDLSGLSQLVADEHAVWFSSPGGVFTYTPTGGFKKLPGLTGQLAGPCF